MILQSGALDRIAEILDQAPAGTGFVRNTSWALSNLCRGRPLPEYDTVKRAIPTLIKVLAENDAEEIVTDACWALSYLADAAKDEVDDLFDVEMLVKMITLLSHQNISIITPCLKTIGNIASDDDDQTELVIELGLIDALNEIVLHQKALIRKEACWVLSNITAGTQPQI